MKINLFLLKRSALSVLTTCLLSVGSLQAQTFVGRENLAQSPSNLEAAVYPLSNSPSKIKVIFNNPAGGSVRVMIRDGKGNVFYDEYESITRYRRCFDLSGLPQGNYKVELSKRKEQYTQAFTIEPPAPAKSHIALVNPPIQKTPDKPADRTLTSNSKADKLN